MGALLQEGWVLWGPCWGLELCIQKTLKTWWPTGRAVGCAVRVLSPRGSHRHLDCLDTHSTHGVERAMTVCYKC